MTVKRIVANIAASDLRVARALIEFGSADEPWGVRRFFVRDPFNRLVNVLAHTR